MNFICNCKIKIFILLLLLIYLKNNHIKSNSQKYINNINLSEYNTIKIGIYTHSLINGGVERNTALLINYLAKNKNFELYLYNQKKTYNEYKIPSNVKRVIIHYQAKELKLNILKNKIDIFIYQLYDIDIISMLQKIKNLKIIFYIHSCFLFWIYSYNNFIFKNVYNEYKKGLYIISLVPFENNYLFKKWGINSIYLNNFLTYEYKKVIQSDLCSKNILMIGRAGDKYKRFDLGIIAMKFIIKEIIDSQMIIISDDNEISNLKDLINHLYLEDNIKFVGYTSNPEIFFKNISLHIFPSIAEAFPMVLSETKIYGIPSILLGIDYVSTAKGGVITIYDESPETISNVAIKILKDYKYRKYLGREARKSMKKFDNDILFKKWVKLIIAIKNGEDSYKKIIQNDKSLKENESKYILENQIKLLKKRIPKFNNITLNDILNFSFIKELNFV